MEAPAPVEEDPDAPADADGAAAASAPENPAVLRLKRQRRRRPDDAPSYDLEERLAEFQHSPHYLRIPASSVSALCGLHPFQDLPQLLYELVYQSYLGQLLLQRDAQALGLTVVDAKAHEQETMLSLASAASKEAKELVQQVLEVSEGKRKLQSVDEVQSIQKKIKQHATKAKEEGKLSHKQVESLVEASRGHVSTGFGTCHEDDALDAYEKQMGCKVRERNEALVEWRFERLADEGSELGVTAFPMGPAKRKDFGQMLNKLSSREDGKEGGGEYKSIEIDLSSEKDARSKTAEFQEATKEDVIVMDDNGETDSREDKKPAAKTERGAETAKIKPFFRIVGAVDGVRDELYTAPSAPPAKGAPSADARNNAGKTKNTVPQPSNTQDPYSFSDDDEEQWSLRPIIVECKHRMNEAKIPPPLYDVIQTCLYCMMYNTEEADLIQVVRRKNASGKSEEKENEAVKDNKSDDEKDDGKAKSEDMKITVTRVSLNDPIHNHSHHWRATLLPRLSSFVDAVYSLRRDDGKRYRLLMALVQCQQEEGSGKAEEEAWRVLWEECPWLAHCDTAFGRRRRWSLTKFASKQLRYHFLFVEPRRDHPTMKLLHPAATIFLDHLLSGIAEENEKVQASIDRLLPVREFIESDEKSDRHVDCPEPNFDVEEARFAIVEALSSSDSQLELVSENLRLKTELSRLDKAAEVLGSVEISNGIGGKATLSLRDGRFVRQNGIPTWFLAENLDMPFTDLSSIECVVSGVPLQPDPMLDADSAMVHHSLGFTRLTKKPRRESLGLLWCFHSRPSRTC